MKIIEYVKSHPWTVGALVVGAGVTFFVVRGAMGGGSSTTVAASSGPSEDAQLAFAGLQLQAGAANAAASADVAKSSIAADVAKYLGGLDAQAQLANIDAQRSVSLADIGASASSFTIQNQTAKDVAQINAATDQLNITTSGDVAKTQITTNANIITSIIDAFKPQPPAPIVVAPAPTTREATLTDFMAANPDIGGWYTSHQSKKDKAEYQKLGIGSVQDYVSWHLANFAGDATRNNVPGTLIHI